MKKRHHVAVQMEKEQQYKIDNGPIDMTVDQLWRYSGEVEAVSSDLYNETLVRNLKAIKAPLKCRKQYYQEYWQEYKLKQI
jgi:hypothetical protein|tara:strand:+ start:179 stop:421 length:243 start_codon:yes stop_codon:yes gene_type:complete